MVTYLEKWTIDVKPHEYSLIRCYPAPSTGECLNLGALVGNPTSGEWAVRLLKDQRRVARFAGAGALSACLAVVAELNETLAENDDALESGADSTLGPDWLGGLVADHNNLIRFSTPSSVMADTLDEAVDRVFRFRISEPQRREATEAWLTRNTLKAVQRDSLSRVAQAMVHEGAELFVGANVSSRLDFAVGNGSGLLLTHGWSFLVGGVAEVGTQVKAWAYALERLRSREEARLMWADGATAAVADDIRLAVIVSDAQTPEQRTVREESLQVLREIRAHVVPYGEESQITEMAAELISA